MKNKLFKIKNCKTCEEVLVAMSRGGEGKAIVEIQAWHDHPEDGEIFQIETIEFESELIASRFVADFSEVSANEFANSFTF